MNESYRFLRVHFSLYLSLLSDTRNASAPGVKLRSAVLLTIPHPRWCL